MSIVIDRENKHYIGDGAYARFDVFGLVLTTEDGISVQNTVYLGPTEFISLLKIAAMYYDPVRLREAIPVPEEDEA